MLPPGDDLDAIPIIRNVRSVAIELLTRDDGALRERIRSAGSGETAVRTEILRASERRQAKVPGRGEAMVQLFAMPLIVDYGDQKTEGKRETLIVDNDELWAGTIARIWRSCFPGDDLDIRPLPYLVHLNGVLDVSPSTVHAQVFRGASIYEGREQKPLPMCAERNRLESAGGPVPMTYLMLAYVASPAGKAAPAAGVRPMDAQAQSYMRGFFALMDRAPSVQLLQPRRFYDALNSAQQAHLGHFLIWCARNKLDHRIDFSPADEDTGEVTITGWFQSPGAEHAVEACWKYDSTWRGPFDSQAVMRSAREEVGLGAEGSVGATRSPEDTRGSRPLH
jgi:hypothetical protein